MNAASTSLVAQLTRFYDLSKVWAQLNHSTIGDQIAWYLRVRDLGLATSNARVPGQRAANYSGC